MTIYDTVPYPSHCHPTTSPGRLKAIAQIFSHASADLETAEILEIGCASGGNILPMATRYPKASFTGIDYSQKQISIAREKQEELGIENVTFKAESILDSDLKGKKFDYIIAHGVYSWVDNDVQKRILQICGENLARNGVAFVSYNTLPGWNAIKTIRDMMLYHSQNFTDPAQKVVEARNMLKFVSDNLQTKTGPYKETLEAEIKVLQDAQNNYFFHDHLEVVNEPCYFHEFIEKASGYRLAYLGDAELPAMFIGNYSEKVSETLGQINDGVRQEQYLDFINNRRFRSTLLVKADSVINRDLQPAVVDGLRFMSRYILEKPLAEDQLGKIEELDLCNIANNEHKINIKGRIACACYIALLQASPNILTTKEIAVKAAKMLGDVDQKQVHEEFSNLILDLIFKGILVATAGDHKVAEKVSAKPKAFDLARLEARSGDLVPNARHECVRLSTDLRVDRKSVV